MAGIRPRWPEPADHEGDWLTNHGRAARADAAGCANCHVQSSCTACHGDGPEAQRLVTRLVADEAAHGLGVRGDGERRRVHPTGFRLGHGPSAAGATNCGACHDTRAFCEACHQGTVASGFHPPGYVNRHAADVYARDVDCSSCHSNEASCRACHENAGLAGFTPETSSYHDAQPFWLIGHGAAARQSMDACASCHAQTDCLQCHSARSGWRINPHGKDFEADRLGDRALFMCSACHAEPLPG